VLAATSLAMMKENPSEQPVLARALSSEVHQLTYQLEVLFRFFLSVLVLVLVEGTCAARSSPFAAAAHA